MDRVYSEKETEIYNGLLELLKNGSNPYSMTVSEIATSAGVGKGTIYDYFKTKEEVIVKAILFNLYNELEQVRKQINSKNNFKDKFFEILVIIEENIQENMENMYSTFNLFSSVHTFFQMNENTLMVESGFLVYIQDIHDTIIDLLESGFKEGCINRSFDKDDYPMMVIKSALCVFINSIILKRIKGINVERTKENAYEIVLKTLN